MSAAVVEGLRVAFGGVEVVHGVSFRVEPGECVAIVGESGSGKSVLARALLGLSGGTVAGSVRVGDVDVVGASGRTLRRLRGAAVGFVPQDALLSLDPLRPIGREIGDVFRLHGRMPASERARRAVEVLASVGMPEPAERSRERSGELSGGLRQRALVAAAVAFDPPLLVADEPTTALDVTVQARVLALFAEQKARGRALLLVSHDLAVVAGLADRILVLDGGRVVEEGTASQVLRAPRSAQARALVAAVPAGRPRGSRLMDPSAPARPPAEPGEVVLRASGLVTRFALPGGGSRTAVDDVGLELRCGETLGLVGESGSGKSTVARLLLALRRPDEGVVELFGEPWSEASERRRRPLRPRIGAVYQDSLSSFDPRWSVGRLLRDAGAASVPALLASVGLGPELERRSPRTLSGGQRQRVSIARALATRPDMLICDEPVSALDVSVQAQILDLLDDLQREHGLALLVISHDLGVIAHLSDRIAVMRAGRVVESGPAASLLAAPRDEYTRALLAAAPRLPGG
ncbi:MULTISPECIES: ATP-binding cassette domain-containing protein [unclassified Rathayibacter]|uniref:ATP-binding cassette domain-containing protein n=1 Tax=unclassified Rathayibacter TaxID=2609250 RepID=UPI00188CDCA1|nr:MULTISPECIES: ABC transporter ATP-binding protein [unclassified Rathayibacter]MBF4463107.1 ABC transporter ATP-binding protein [Rathayibacter sp. VKM Ac-2879]MBF4504656.1 ABC transporter ATP-binding protein [Rathayibacter sp. VKM Ac-2878]